MYGPSKAESSKPKYSKLRASCDTCFTAKVKCSKARPICSRCLVCGADCKYSPSSRAGKPKSDGSHRRSSAKANRYPTPSMIIDVEHANSYVETDWSSIMGTPNEPVHRNSISSPLPANGDETGSFVDPTLQPPFISWYEPAEAHHHSTSAPSLQGSHNHHAYSSNQPTRSATCNCFNTCLSALQALHNSDAITATSPFDVILTINQRAVETCSTMLHCPICTSKAGASSLRTMLLGTILGRIISIYQDASKSYFALSTTPSSTSTTSTPTTSSSPSSHHNNGYIRQQQQQQQQQLPLTFGTYRVASEDVRWLQMEILLRDLKKLKELFARFQETSLMLGESEEDAGMHGAVSNYLCQSLDLTFESLRKQRSFTAGGGGGGAGGGGQL
ncbi:transcription factor [Drepanopeziza brunnea f. sp. 'multigermtubi' MB_m1]|uniref:Transcription factor n=1 Tax=Marssonina brunnea f. sp. multigermtubi (strain MB_m1) TaxID=1072389 RepID=K1X810_MARBU|nr:transcription factor [Drepanopeziza brunnea f. sp. 'multigermtubi' MB_m1]EKD21146.1 transcription factor [Drepanopeziza brunnea f. sp. 'multigermtubi' MB_m1]